MEEKIRQLRKISGILLDPSRKWEDYDTALKGFHLILSGITGIQGAIKNRSEGYETQLPSGLALSPGYAADCALDTKRTVKFIHALDLAFKRQKGKVSGGVNVFYAGSGPFAPFALPFILSYSPDEIRFTLADIHGQSIAAIKKIIEAIDCSGSVNEYIECDITGYSHHGKYPLHILISETMHRTLSREPHAMITISMRDQLAEDGLIIPESVQIEAVLSRLAEEVKYLEKKITEDEINKIRLSLGPVFELTKDINYDFAVDGKLIKGPVKSIDFDPGNKNILILLTKIKLFGSIGLFEKESGITFPGFVQEIGKIEKGDRIKFGFNLDQFPGMICEKIKEEQDVLKALDSLCSGKIKF